LKPVDIKKISFFIVLFCFLSIISFAQRTIIKGTVIDGLTKEPISFASAFLKKNGKGKITDSLGNFNINIENNQHDTLVISYIGYEPVFLIVDSLDVNKHLFVYMDRNGKSNEFVVKIKINKGMFVWKKIMSKKKYFNRYNQKNFSYEAYNKIEIDIKNFNAEKAKKNYFLRPYSFIFNSLDSTIEGTPYLPAYLVESVSDYAFQKKPRKFYENIKAVNAKGLENENFNKFLGVMNQNINIFDNYINVMGKDFISPFNDNADFYYNFSVIDTQVIDNIRTFRFVFKPKRSGENVFEGDAWVRAGSFQVIKTSISLSKDANINYISRIGIFQEFSKINDTTFFLSRDKFFADFNALGKNSLTLIGKKTTSYKNILLNSDSISKLFLNQKTEEVIKENDPTINKTDSLWSTIRHDSLSVNEKQIYQTVDKLLKMPKFQRLQKTLRFIGTGYRNIDLFEIGPWYNWISNNSLEGYRMRFDLGTNTKFKKNIYLHGYLAYGTLDYNVKGKAEAYWIAQREPNRLILHASYADDIDNGISQIGEVSQDNIFSLAIMKPNYNQKFIRLRDTRFDLSREWNSGFSTSLFLVHRNFNPLKGLPNKSYFSSNSNNELTSFEVSLKLRFAYLEQFLNWDYFRYSLGSKYPIAEVILTRGIAGVMKSTHNYSKINANITGNLKLAPLGSVSFKLYGGYINGNLPFLYLENHLGNDIYYYKSNSLNLMNRFEYLSDKFAGINIEHNMGSGIFKFLPITRKLKWRQFWNIKSLWGDLSDENKKINGGELYFKSLNNNNYTEIGTGIDNIFKVFRVDMVWNLTSTKIITLNPTNRFGIFGSFQIQF